MSDNMTTHRIGMESIQNRRTIVAGTTVSVSQWHRALEHMSAQVHVMGCVLARVPEEINQGELGVPILGGFDDLASVLEDHHPVDLVLVSVPVAMQHKMRRLTAVLEEAGVAWRFMPTFADQLAGRLGPAAGVFSAIDTQVLINRQPHPLDEPAIRQTLAGRCVLITGAGGSIGSELARLVGRFAPSKLVLVERAENALFEIDRQLARTYPDVCRAAVLHDVTDAERTLTVVKEHQPDAIFHAAAHKHVPMMEDYPAQAVENNFFGTQSIADAAHLAGVERFVMISTDKAVNPSSVMGATKRLAELYVQDLNTRSQCICSMVRFGNVLGSACSVLPIWSQQLSQGGPITVTHPQMHRYFMTIPEAAGLVLQSAALSGIQDSQAGEVFVLNMGQSVRIVDLAHRFIHSHGLEPDVDIAIRFTGPRPGEKMYEELVYDTEDIVATPHDAVRIWRSESPDPKRIEQIIGTFVALRDKGGHRRWQQAARESIMVALRTAVPEMVMAAAG